MKIYLEIALLLNLLLFSPLLKAQDKELVVAEVAQDDLGNVNDEFQEYFFEALKQKAIENHERAIQALEKCLELDPRSVVYFELGKNYNALEKYNEASIYLEKAKQVDPGNEAVLTELYSTYYQDHKFEKALPVVEELRKINSSFSEDLANLYILNEEYDKALELLDTLDEQWGDSEYREGLRRQVYAKTNNVDARIGDIKKKIAEEPDEEKNYLNLIFVYSETGHPEKAFAAAKELLEKNPNSEMVHLALYKFYLEAKDPEKAVASMKVILKGDEVDEETKYMVLNDFLLFIKEKPDLQEDLMEVVEVFSKGEGNTEVFTQLGAFFLENDQKEKALEFFEVGLAKGNSEFNLLLSTLLLQLEFGKGQEAKLLSEKALTNYPSQPILYLINGTVLNQLGEFDKAKEILTFGLDFLIENPVMEADFYLQLGIAYRGLKSPEEAAEFERKAAQLKTTEVNE